MWLSHLTRHRTGRHGDSLDVLADETAVLRDLFDMWARTDRTGKSRDQQVNANWEHGTVGKLVLEHAAVVHAALRDVAGALERTDDDGASDLRAVLGSLRPHLDRLDGAGRGIGPLGLSQTPDFLAAVDDLAQFMHQHGLLDGTVLCERYRSLLGADRAHLHSARFIRSHAPTRPTTPSWMDRVPGVLRVHAALDRLRGFPWGESTVADRSLAEHFDREAQGG